MNGCMLSKHCAVMLNYRGYTSSQGKEEKHEGKKCPQMDLILCPPACKANFAKHCVTAYVLIDANRCLKVPHACHRSSKI